MFWKKVLKHFNLQDGTATEGRVGSGRVRQGYHIYMLVYVKRQRGRYRKRYVHVT